jgi:hypothetical protein
VALVADYDQTGHYLFAHVQDLFRRAFVAYLVGAGFMIFAAVVEVLLGVRAEGQSLENVATPLTAIEESTGKSAASSAT